MAIQERLCTDIARTMGYDFSRGRIDRAPHPFCSGMGPGDVRITVRYDEENFLSAVLVTLHEGGHALYDQGLLPARWGTPLGSAVSLGVHESQSRLWENYVGRSPRFARFVSGLLGSYGVTISVNEIFDTLTYVAPSLIRVEADQLTYPLHVWVRTQLEIELLDGALEVADLPGRWAALYRDYLGIEPESDEEGVLQDVHWYHGAFGYFPTYVLGELTAAMLHQTIRDETPSYDDLVERGQWTELRQWLAEKIYRHGRRWRLRDLVYKSVGQPFSPDAYLEQMRRLVKGQN
jgi:carboxypeptidase Taq